MVAVNYDNDTITLDNATSWTIGDPVSYLYEGNNPDIGAYEYIPEVCDDEIDNDYDGLVDCDDPDCDDPPQIVDGPDKVSNSEELSDNESAPTSVSPVIWAVAWEFEDDYDTNDCCSTAPTVAWDYRTSDNESWVHNTALRFQSYGVAHFDEMDDGDYQFRSSVTDCDNQTTYSTIRYITIE